MKTTAWILVGSGVLGSLSQFPNTHAFFNIFAGGPRNGPFHLLDSNVDWGQDVLLLDNWAKKNPGRPLTGVAHAIPDWTGIRDLTTLQRNSVPKVIRSTHTQAEINPSGAKDDGPKPGRFALSVRAIYEKNWGYTYFQQMTPVEYVGQTIRIYELSESDVIRIREQYGYPPLGRKSNPEASR